MRINERQLRRLVRSILLETEWKPGDVIGGAARPTTKKDIDAIAADFGEFDRLKSVVREIFPELDDKKIHDLIMKSMNDHPKKKATSQFQQD
jgi:hypothetical protein